MSNPWERDIISDKENMEEFILNMDREMAKKSFEYFFTELLEFMYNDHHKSWHDGLANHQYYCVKASRDHGKSVFFMPYALWIAAFKPNTHIMIFSHSLEQTLEHMGFIVNRMLNSSQVIPNFQTAHRLDKTWPLSWERTSNLSDRADNLTVQQTTADNRRDADLLGLHATSGSPRLRVNWVKAVSSHV